MHVSGTRDKSAQAHLPCIWCVRLRDSGMNVTLSYFGILVWMLLSVRWMKMMFKNIVRLTVFENWFMVHWSEVQYWCDWGMCGNLILRSTSSWYDFVPIFHICLSNADVGAVLLLLCSGQSWSPITLDFGQVSQDRLYGISRYPQRVTDFHPQKRVRGHQLI